MMTIKKILFFLLTFQVLAVVSSEHNQLSSYQASPTPTNTNVGDSVKDKKDYQPVYYTLKNQNDCSDDCKICCGSLVLFFTRFNITISV